MNKGSASGLSSDRRSRRCLAGLRVTAAVVACGGFASAGWSATDTWQSTSGSNWSSPSSWNPVGAPANDGTASIIFSTSGGQTTSTVDLSYSIHSLSYTAAAPAYQLNAASSSVLTLGSAGITDASSAGQTITAPISLGSAQTWMVGSGGDLTVNSIVSGSGPLTVTGGGVVTLTGSNTYTGGVAITGATLAISSSSGADQTLGDTAGPLVFTGGTLDVFGPSAGVSSRTFTFNGSGGTLQLNSDFFIAGSLAGSAPVTKTGDNTLSIEGDNSTYTGAANLTAGTTSLYSFGGNPLGAGNATLAGGSVLNVFDQIQGSVAHPATTTTGLGTGTNTTFTYGSGGGILKPASASTDGGSILATTLGGYTDGTTPSLARSGAGTLIIAPANGTAASSFGVIEQVKVSGSAGNLPTITNGIVSPTIVGQNNDGNFTGDFLTYNTSAGFVSAASAYSAGFNSASSTELANITSAASISSSETAYAVRVNNTSVTLGISATLNVGDGTAGHQAGIIFNGTGPFITGGKLAFGGSEATVYTAQSATISSVITGSNGLTTFGPGTLSLFGANTYSGPTTINGYYGSPGSGVLLTGAGTLGAGTAVTVNHYATLTANGVINGTTTVNGILTGVGRIQNTLSVNAGGLLAPGNLSSYQGTLQSDSLTLTTGSTAEFEVGTSATMYLGYTQMNVIGTVSLGGAALDLVGQLPAENNAGPFFLVFNDGTDPVTGTFAGLPQDSIVTASDGEAFRISYTADSTSGTFENAGNDVAIKPVGSVPEPATGMLAALGITWFVRRPRRSRPLRI